MWTYDPGPCPSTVLGPGLWEWCDLDDVGLVGRLGVSFVKERKDPLFLKDMGCRTLLR